MRRYWIETRAKQGNLVIITGDVYHHVCEVCRLHVGSRFEVINEESKAFLVELKEMNKKQAIAEVIEERVITPLPRPHIHIALSVPRFTVMDAIVEKAVEMGVKTITPFVSDFSFIRKTDEVFFKKMPRWQKIIRSATQQSGRGELMDLRQVISFDELLEKFQNTPQTMGLFAYEGESLQQMKEYLQSPAHKKLQEVWIFVGSEGGFSSKEVKKFQEVGLKPVTLGEQVLRVETACIALVSVVKYELDLMV